ncbi:MAG: PVC-type heme-binding CxxCH protein [Verrucomicrobiaceae bacterium]
MNRFICAAFFGTTIGVASSAEAWVSRELVGEFYAEGAGVGDVDGDGAVDLVYGPWWLKGPGFGEKRRYTKGEPFVGERGYSDHFFSFVRDFDGDGRSDLLVFGFPGKEARLYVNPGGESEEWPMFVVATEVANEAPYFADLIAGGHEEIVCARSGEYGFYKAGEDVTKPWAWHAVSGKGEAATPFGHGLGVGDVNGDGRLDVVEKMSWYEQPVDGGAWTRHAWEIVPYGGGGAQILVHDFDGDGDGDVVSSFNAHGHGLGWFEQLEGGRFERHHLMGKSSTEGAYGVAFSQLHALEKADVDGDGRMDFVTGKRYLAHQGKDVGGLEAPVLYWFRNTVGADGELEFVPHLIDDDSGVGVGLPVADLNGDGTLDVVTANKKGLIVHLQQAGARHEGLEKWKVAGGRSQKDYGSGLSAEEALKRMEVPEGFEVDLIASEPEVRQPIAMCFDVRGRIWVVEGHTYPVRAPEGEGKDRILILEDADGDGTFESRKVFAEGLNLVSGIEVGFGGVYVGAAPYFLFIADRDGDDVPDGEPEVLLDGWGYEDTHETLNAFTWGPDGWLYGCHGVFTHSKVGKPGTPEGEREPINAGVWRFHPETQEFEVYAHGTSNPWGVDFNEYGDWFVSACVIPHFFHLSQGGRYRRQAGQHFDAHTYDDIKTIADHAHFAGNIRDHAFWGVNKDNAPAAPSDTSALGGGHAHCGLVLYQGEEFPERYRGQAFFHNLHGHRMVREELERDGSGFVARHRPDFLLTNNHDFIGVGLMQGPDGALYFSDWVDPQTCHHRDVKIWDRSNGRIFRVRYGDVQKDVPDLGTLGDGALVAMLGSGNAVRARMAQRLLQERAVAGTFEVELVRAGLDDFEKRHRDSVPMRLRGLWAKHVCGVLSEEELLVNLDDGEEVIRGWSVQLLGEGKGALAAPIHEKLVRMAKDDYSLVVRRYLASLLQRLPLEQRWEIAEGLIGHHRSEADRNIPLLSWYGIEPLVVADPVRALGLVSKTPWAGLKGFVLKRASGLPEGRVAMMTALERAGSAGEFERLGRELLRTLESGGAVEMPDNWAAMKARGEGFAARNAALFDLVARLGVRFGDEAFFPKWRQVVVDGEQAMAKREEAMELLLAGKDAGLKELALEVLGERGLQKVALRALRDFPGADTAAAIVEALPKFALPERNDAINLLATRPEMALALLKAVDSGGLSASLISPVMLDQFGRFHNEQIDALVEKNWARAGAEVDLAKLGESIKEWEGKLSGPMKKANASRGRQVYTVTCGSCHQLFGEGIALGPDLTGSNRTNLHYVLENVLAPSAVVGRDYLLHVFKMKDGSTVSGMIRKETEVVIRLAMPGGSVVEVEVGKIESRMEYPQSLMPSGLFEALPLQEVADLVAYLASPAQVALPGEKREVVQSAVGPPAKGVIRVEVEQLVGSAHAGGGLVRDQGMAGFGPGWSGNNQLWWTGGKPGDVLTLKVEALKPGTKNVTLFPTTAVDYARVKIAINGQLQEADWFSKKVLPGEPVRFEKVNVSPGEPMQIDIHITGKNPEAVPGYMVGLDRIEVEMVE